MNQSSFDHTQNKITGFQKTVRKCHNQSVEKSIQPVELVRQLHNQFKNSLKTFKQASGKQLIISLIQIIVFLFA